MTDFLSSLLSRNTPPVPGQGTEMSLRPRPVSLYENLTGETGPDTPEEPSNREEHPATDQPRSADGGDLGWLSIWRSHQPALPEQSSTPAPLPEPAPPPRNQIMETIQSSVGALPELSPVGPAEPQPPSLLIREIHQPVPSAAIVPAPMPAIHQRDAEEPPRRLDPSPGKNEAPVRAAPRPSLGQPAAERGAIRQAERLTPPILPPSPETAPAPVVHISIGRIEVRAAATPVTAAGQRANRGAPVMALEEYLRRRNGGQT